MKKLTHEDFVHKQYLIHKDTYTNLSDYKSSFEKMKFNCKEHGEFEQTPAKHLSGSGCMKCGWNKTITSHKVWTDEKLSEVCLLYIDKRTFRKEQKSAYTTLVKTNRIEKFCSHMIHYEGNRFNRIVYAYEFKKSVYIGLTYDINERDYNRKLNPNDSVTKHILETGENYNLKILTPKYVPAQEASKLEIMYVEYYKNLGYEILNKCKAGNLGGSQIKWNEETIKNEVGKYKYMRDFLKNSSGCYNAAKKLNIFEEITKDLLKIDIYSNYITVYQYDKYGNFIEEFPSASSASRKIKVSPSNILACINGKQKSCKGFIWKKDNIAGKIIENSPVKEENAEQAKDLIQDTKTKTE